MNAESRSSGKRGRKPSTEHSPLGEFLERLREQRGLSPKKWEGLLEISHSGYHGYLYGGISWINSARLSHLASVLGVDEGTLLDVAEFSARNQVPTQRQKRKRRAPDAMNRQEVDGVQVAGQRWYTHLDQYADQVDPSGTGADFHLKGDWVLGASFWLHEANKAYLSGNLPLWRAPSSKLS